VDSTNSVPPVDEPVIVEYETCHCVGYLDPQGQWRDWFSDHEIKGVIGWRWSECWPTVEPMPQSLPTPGQMEKPNGAFSA